MTFDCIVVATVHLSTQKYTNKLLFTLLSLLTQSFNDLTTGLNQNFSRNLFQTHFIFF